MRDTGFGDIQTGASNILLTLMLNRRQDCWSRRTTTDATFRIIMFLMAIAPLFLLRADKTFQPQASSGFLLICGAFFTALLWNSARNSLDRSMRRIEEELFLLARETGQLADSFIRSKDMRYPGLINRNILLSVLEPALCASMTISAVLLSYVKAI